MANMINVLNTIRANGSTEYQSRVPEATRNNLAEVGSAIMNYKALENEFLQAFVEKIALTQVWNRTYKNPLAVLKKGNMPLGRNLEEIYINPATGTTYDPQGLDLLGQTLPDVKTIYHSNIRRGKYKVTISKAQLITAFTSYGELENLLNLIVNTLYSGDNYDELILMKNLFASALVGGKMKHIKIDEIVDLATAKAFVKSVKTIGNDMAFPKSTYNTYYEINKDKEGVTPAITWTPKENQILILRNDVSVNVDVEMLAQAFNVSYAEMSQRIIVVDNFGEASDCCAMLIDEAYPVVRDTLTQLDSFYNPEGLYTNYILHHWQLYSVSLFANAIAFVTSDAYDGEETTDDGEETTDDGETVDDGDDTI